MGARYPQWVHSSRWPPSAAVRHRSMARSTLTCFQQSQWRFRSMKTSPAARMISATSRGGRSSTSRRVACRSVVASPKDLLLRSDGVARDASRRSFLSGLDDRVGAEWRGDRCRLRVDEWRSSASECEDAHVSECPHVGRLSDTRAKRFSYRWADPCDSCWETARCWICGGSNATGCGVP